MVKRVQVGDLQEPQPIQPQARPIDTYYQPQADPVAPPPKTNSLLQLAESLRQIQPGLDRYVDNKVEQLREEEISRGAEAALNNREGFNAAIKAGAIQAGTSPWFRIGYERMALQILGNEYDTKLRGDYSNSDVLETGDIEPFIQERRDVLLNDLHAKGFKHEDISELVIPKVLQTEDRLRGHYSSERAKYLEEKFVDDLSGIAQSEFDKLYKSSNSLKLEALQNVQLFKDKTGSFDQTLYIQWAENKVSEWQKAIGSQLTAQMNEILKTYPKPKVVNDAIVAFLESRARSQDDPDILDIAKYIDIGNKRVLSDIPEYQTKFDIIRESVDNNYLQKILQQNQLKDIQRENRAEDHAADLLNKFQNNQAPSKDAFLQQIGDVGLSHSKRLIEYYDILSEAVNKVPETKENNTVIATQSILAETGQANEDLIFEGINLGAIDGKQGVEMILQNQEARKQLGQLPQGVKDLFRELDDIFVLPGGTLINQLKKPEITLQKQKAVRYIKNRVLTYKQRNPEAADFEIEEEAQKAWDMVVERWNKSGLKANFAEQSVKPAPSSSGSTPQYKTNTKGFSTSPQAKPSNPSKQSPSKSSSNKVSLPWAKDQSSLDVAYQEAVRSGFKKGAFSDFMRQHNYKPEQANKVYNFLKSKL